MSPAPRSFLFTPGSRPDRFLKAAGTKADAVIFDLEDAVAEIDKVEARRHVVDFLNGGTRIAQHIVVRINPINRVCGLEDLAALAVIGDRLDYLLMPKVEAPDQIIAVSRILDDAGSTARIGALIETARGIAEAAAVAQADSRLAFMMFGAADYAADLGQDVSSFRPLHGRGALVNAAACGGVTAIDSPFFAIDRPDELRAECLDGRSLGFYGKAAIHPAQLAAINETYETTAEERARAERILGAAPEGVGVLDGKMVDIAMARWALRIAGRPIGTTNIAPA